MKWLLLALSLLHLSVNHAQEESGSIKTKQKEAALRMIRGYMKSGLQQWGDQEDDYVVDEDARTLFGHLFSDEELYYHIEEAYESSNGHYADRFINEMIDTVEDPDCMEREFNVRDSTYSPQVAVHVLRKCKLLVLRNVFDVDNFLSSYKNKFTGFMNSLNDGHISINGGTSNGENYYLASRGAHRWEITLPREYADEELILNPHIMEVLTNDHILGEDMALHSLGANAAEPGASAQSWHHDMRYLFGQSSVETHGVGGHDLPAYAVTVLVSMTNLTRSHGPTEFCMGSSAVEGMSLERLVADETFEDHPRWNEYRQARAHDICAPSSWRSPVVNFGDVVLFDYQLSHRGGRNDSNDMRSVVFMTFSRSWYKDTNFRNDGTQRDDFQRLVASARFAVPDKMRICNEDNLDCQPKTTKLEAMRDFLRNSPQQHEPRESEEQYFEVSNKDLGPVLLFLNNELIIDQPLESEETLSVTARSGDTLGVRSAGDNEVYTWYSVFRDQSQIVLDRERIKANLLPKKKELMKNDSNCAGSCVD